ncbi:MAG: hypothetical protein ACPGPF_00375 [Pontibacterium sp.]
MHTQRQRSGLFSVLKQLVRSEGFTYKQVGEHLALSEPSVKRMFQSEDCKLSRLIELCDLVGVSLSELIDLQKRDELNKGYFLPTKTEAALANDPHLAISFLLLLSGVSGKEIQSLQSLTPEGYWQTLRKLEGLELLRTTQGSNHTLTISTPVRWRYNGTMQKLLTEINIGFIRETFAHTEEENVSLHIASRSVSETSLQQLHAGLQALYEQFNRQARLDQLYYSPEQLKPFKLVTALGPFDLPKYLEHLPKN